MISVNEHDFGILAICAIRYCQDRQTYMPDLVRGIVKPILPKLEDNDIDVLLRDCEYQEQMRLYGDEQIDKPGWLKWEEVLKAEKNRRTSDG